MGLQRWMDNLRKWVDEEEDQVQDEPRPPSKWEDFLVSVAREVEQAMLREMFTPPGGPTYIPREYTVFLSAHDDAEWQGEKRQGLERGLQYVLSERARELVGEKDFQTKSFIVELRVDPALETGKFRVQHVWDAETQKTVVRPRKKGTLSEPRDDEVTIVRPRKTEEPAFTISLKRLATEAASDPVQQRFYKDEITIGRGSRNFEVDLRLDGDMEVSRKHATLVKGVDGKLTLTCHGANPIALKDGRELQRSESAEIAAGEAISICSYELVIDV